MGGQGREGKIATESVGFSVEIVHSINLPTHVLKGNEGGKEGKDFSIHSLLKVRSTTAL